MRKRIDAFLSQGSNLVGIDLHYFAKGGFWLTASQVATGITGFILSIIYARFLSKQAFGQYTYVLSFVSFFAIFAYPGMDKAIVRAVAQGRDLIVKQATKKTLPWAIISALPLLALSGYYLLKPSPDPSLGKTFIIVFILTVPLWVFRFFHPYFIGSNQLKLFFLATTAHQLLSLIGLGLAAVFLKTPFFLLLVGLTIQTLLSLAFSLFSFHLLRFRQPQPHDFAYAQKMNDVIIFSNLSQYADKIILAKLLGFEAVAVYTFARIVPDQIRGVLRNISVLTLPKLSLLGPTHNFNQFKTKLRLFVGIAGLVTLFYFLAAPFIFRVFFPAYIESIVLTRIMSLLVVSAPALVITSLFESQANIRTLRWQIYPTHILQLVLLITFSWLWGAIGTAWAVALGNVMFLLIGWIILKKNYG